ncbi:hypothetical protein RHMOL_Rhmol05G0087800 [Rhododendron molle]|uniref:Uncharacterized protein n=1 Tax=Rhododendron molle TaxID=49168 RepID=A0ACC0NLP4_RHOML|nr:hypothetical protein RHMOL_Rhmol05G0087800 [Rhododendron molle]
MLAEPKKCLITLKAYMHNYARTSQIKFNVHTISIDNSIETGDRSKALPPNPPNKRSKKEDHNSSTSTSNPTIDK